jgi:shikimate kinase
VELTMALPPNDIPLREKNIVLTGFMGVGKTTIGKRIASKLYRDFIDADKEIEKKYNLPVSQIFATMGEQKFREIEKNMICDLCRTTRLKVISLGGGAFMNEETRQVCLSTAIVLFLDLSWDSWKNRLSMIIDSRPVLKDKSLEEIEELFYRRHGVYSLNNSKITTDDLDAEEAADYIINTLKLGWEIYEPH